METKMSKPLNTILLVLVIVVLAGGIFFAGTQYARWNMMFGWGGSTGFGMMNGNGGPNMMGGNGGMMNRYNFNKTNFVPLTVDEAKTAAEKYIQSLDVKGLQVGEVIIFDNNAYVVVKETETGLGAFELLVDSGTKIACPEYGPNMMWNVKYSRFNHQ